MNILKAVELLPYLYLIENEFSDTGEHFGSFKFGMKSN